MGARPGQSCTSRGCAACPPAWLTARTAPVSGPPRHLRSSPHPQHGLYPAYTHVLLMKCKRSPVLRGWRLESGGLLCLEAAAIEPAAKSGAVPTRDQRPPVFPLKMGRPSVRASNPVTIAGLQRPASLIPGGEPQLQLHADLPLDATAISARKSRGRCAAQLMARGVHPVGVPCSTHQRKSAHPRFRTTPGG